MPILDKEAVLNLKLKSIPVPLLRELANGLRLNSRGTAAEMVERLSRSSLAEASVDGFIKSQYEQRIKTRQAMISDDELQSEIGKVRTFAWGVVQGQLDDLIHKGVRKKIREVR